MDVLNEHRSRRVVSDFLTARRSDVSKRSRSSTSRRKKRQVETHIGTLDSRSGQHDRIGPFDQKNRYRSSSKPHWHCLGISLRRDRKTRAYKGASANGDSERLVPEQATKWLSRAQHCTATEFLQSKAPLELKARIRKRISQQKEEA